MDSQQIFYISCLGIVAGVAVVAIPILGYFWYEVQKAEQNAVLKKGMIERGFSADEIVRVVHAGSEGSVWDNYNAVCVMQKMIKSGYSADDIAKVMRQGPDAAPGAARPEPAMS